MSRCLLGESVRYDGQHKRDRFITDQLGQFFEWVDVCPEVDCGMPIPRPAMRLVGKADNPKLVTNKTFEDKTEQMNDWLPKGIEILEKKNICGYIFKSGSPSSGLHRVKVYNEHGMPEKNGRGLFAAAVVKRFPWLPVEEEGRLHDAKLRENFIERVFVVDRWYQLNRDGLTVNGLMNFHKTHKYLIMSHDPKATSELGQVIASTTKQNLLTNSQKYFTRLMEVLEKIATVSKKVNTMAHIMGYFKKDLDHGEKKYLLGVIEDYRHGRVPEIVPLTLLSYFIDKFDQEYLKDQLFLNPHTSELKLRNHV